MKDSITGSRVALVYLLDLRSHAQIMQRTAAQVEVFRQNGLDAEAICLDRGLPGALPEGITGIRQRGPGVLRPFFEARALREHLRLIDPQIVIVRYGFATSTLLWIARHFRLLLEIHSDDTQELAQRRLVRVFSRVSGRIFRARLLRAVEGAMFVSSDLALLSAFSSIPAPHAVIPNGIPVPSSSLPAPRHEKAVVGYSVGYAAPWQGLDRLATLAAALPEFDFRLVVPDAGIAIEVADSPVHVVVAEGPDHYRAAIAEFDVALGGLALDRKGIEVASALKVRESVALGIPTLLFSRDEDLEDVEDATVATVARGAWSPLEIAPQVRDFVNGARGRRVPDDLRHRVDIVAKAERYGELIKDALRTSSDRVHPAQR